MLDDGMVAILIFQNDHLQLDIHGHLAFQPKGWWQKLQVLLVASFFVLSAKSVKIYLRLLPHDDIEGMDRGVSRHLEII